MTAPRTALTAASLLCLALAAAGCQSKEQKFAEHLARAEKYMAAGQDKEALVELRSALQVDPKSAEASWRIAETLRQQGRAADARFFYKETSRLDPNRTDAMLLEASLLYGEEPDRAAELIDAVLEKEPNNADAHLRKSELALIKANVDEALVQAMTAVQLEPKKGLYQQQLGIVHRTRIREKRLRKEPVEEALFESAVKAFQKADELDGPYWAYQLDIAHVYASWPGHYEDARAGYRKAVETAIASTDKGADMATLGAARNFAATWNDAELAQWAVETMTKVRPEEVSSWVELARIEEAAGRSGEDVYKRMLETQAKNVDANVAYANWLAARDRADDGFAQLRKSIDAGADAPSTLGAIANLQFRLGRFDDAHKTIDALRAQYPNHPRTVLAMAQLAITEGHLADAAKMLREDSNAQANPEAQRMLAFCEMSLKNLPAATQAINHAVELSPTFAPGIVRLQAQIQHMSKDYSGAVGNYRRLLQNGVTLEPVEELRFVQSLYGAGLAPNGKQRLETLLAAPNPPADVALEYAFRESDEAPERTTEILEAAFARYPDDLRLLDYLTNLDVRAGRAPRALDRLNQSMAQGQVTAGHLLLRGRLLASQKMWAQAETDLRATFEAAPNYPGVSDLLVQVYQAQGRMNDAISSLEQADRSKALGGPQLYLLARLLLEQKLVERARATYERALKADPENADAQNDLAFILADNGQELDRALELARAAQAKRPEDPSVADTLGYTYFKKGLYDPAIQHLRFAVELGGQQKADRPEFHYHLGLALGAAGRPDEARAELDKALAMDPKLEAAAAAKRDLEARQAAKADSANPS